MDNIDVDYAKEKGLHVINTPAASSHSVAELVFSHLFSCVRFLHDSNRNMPLEGDNNFKKLKKNYSKGVELKGKTLGVIGFGRIGQQTAKILASFGANIYFSDPFIENLENNLGEKKEIEYLKENCDILVVAAPLTDDTRDLLNINFFNSLRKKPYIINVSRGGIINEKDLTIALEKELVSGCALDVFEKEPIELSNEIRKSDKVVYSSHNASNTFEANKSVNSQVTNLILEWLDEQ